MVKIAKKFFTVSVVAMTIMWSVGLSALVPMVAVAVDACPELAAGDLYKVPGLTAVYLLNADMESVYFPSSEVYHTWYEDFSGVEEIPNTCIDAYPLAGGVNYRPGSMLVKRDTSPSVYIIEPGNMKTKIGSEEVAAALYGADWASKVRDIASVYWLNFTADGAEITMASLQNGMTVTVDGTINYAVVDGILYEVDGEISAVQTVSQELVDALEMGATTVTAASLRANASQTVAGEVIGGVDDDEDVETPAVTGSVTASLSASTPAGINLPDGTAFNNILKVNLKAGSEAASITGVTLKKGGYLLVTDVTGVDVVDGNDVRHGNVASSFNSDNEVNILFGSNPVNIPANGTVTLSFRVNLLSTATASTLDISLTGLDTTGSVAGLPIKGNSFSVIDGTNAVAGATVTVQAISGALGTSLNADDENYQEITKFRISETASKENLEVHKLTLFNYGNAADVDYKDVQLVAQDGSVVATAQPSAQYVVFDLSASPYTIDKGTYKDFTVRMKIVGGTSKTMQFVVYNDFDLEVKGANTGAYVLPIGGNGDSGGVAFPEGSVALYNQITVSAGTLTFNKDISSPSNSVAPGAANVVLAKYYAKAVGEDMELRKVNFGITQVTTALTGNVYVRVNGVNVYSVAASSLAMGGTTSTASLTSYPILKAGVNSYITVEGSVLSAATGASTYTVNAFDLIEVKKLTSNSISDPSVGAVSGNTIQVNAGSLNAKTLSTPVSQNIVNGNSDFTFANFELDAQSSGENVRISSFIVSNSGTGTVTDVSNLELWDGDAQLMTSNSTATGAASTTFTLSNALIVDKGTVKTLTLKGDVTGAGAGTHQFVLYSVSATAKDTGTTVDVTPTGSGQAMTIASGATVTLSLVSGITASPVSTQVATVGTKDGTYFAFKITPQNEAVKLRTLKLTASGTTLTANDVKNLRLYRNDEIIPFATAAEMSCTAGTCTYTWTASDNLLASAVQPGSPVTVYVKADIGGAGIARLGNDFVFKIAATSTDFIGVGASTASAFVVSGTPTVTAITHLVPFNVHVEGVNPLSSGTTVGLASGAKVGVFKVTNLGTGQITFGTSTFDNAGAATNTMDWVLKGSADGGASTDASVALGAAATSTETQWGDITDATINGGSWRYLTIKTDAVAVNYNTHQWTVNALGQLLYSVTEAQLGYDENANGDLSDTVENLYVTGTPALETVTSRS